MTRINDLLKDLRDYEATPASHGLDLRLSLADIVLRALKRKGWTQKRLAQAAEMKESQITRVIHSDSNCTFDVAGRLLAALGMRAELSEVAETSREDRIEDTIDVFLNDTNYGEEETEIRYESTDTTAGIGFGGAR